MDRQRIHCTKHLRNLKSFKFLQLLVKYLSTSPVWPYIVRINELINKVSHVN